MTKHGQGKRAGVEFAKVSVGVNTKTFAPIFYVEARVAPDKPWSFLTDGKKWLVHRSRNSAERECRSMHRRLAEKFALSVPSPRPSHLRARRGRN